MTNYKVQIGPGGPTLLFLLFLTLKLTNVIDWSWWWVTSPLWITGSIALLMIIILLIFGYRFSNTIDRSLEKMLKKYDK